MPILTCEFPHGGDIHINISQRMVERIIPRIENALRAVEMRMDEWDAMSKRDRNKVLRDYEWFMKMLTQAKLKDNEFILGKLRQVIGTVRENVDGKRAGASL
jgi:hypothetical protein